MTYMYTDEVKEAFKKDLHGTIRKTPRGVKQIILGDFKAPVGRCSCDIWKNVMANIELERQTPVVFSFWRNAGNMG